MKRTLVWLAVQAVCGVAPRQPQVTLFGRPVLKLQPWQEEALRILSPRVDELIARRHAVPLHAVTP